jgi:hypothetical protein
MRLEQISMLHINQAEADLRQMRNGIMTAAERLRLTSYWNDAFA